MHTHSSTQPKLLTTLSNVGPSPIDINQIWFSFSSKRISDAFEMWKGGRTKNGYTLTESGDSMVKSHENQEKWNLRIQQQQQQQEEEEEEEKIARTQSQ